MLWPLVLDGTTHISFAHTSFLWKNNAANNAVVACVIVGLSRSGGRRTLYDESGKRDVSSIGPYLTASDEVIVVKRTTPLSNLPVMQSGNKATDDGNFILSLEEKDAVIAKRPQADLYFKRFVGSKELIQGGDRWVLWIEDAEAKQAMTVSEIAQRVDNVRLFRASSRGKQANDSAAKAHRFVFAPHSQNRAIAVAAVSSERRQYLPCNYFTSDVVISNLASVMYGADLFNLAIIASRIHLVWIATVCGKLEIRYRYSNTLGWNTFPVPPLTAQDKADLTRCAEDILLAREAHYPATIADLYDPDAMPEDLRRAHERNDETLERIYIGRRFRNDTERLEHLFALYTKMTASDAGSGKKGASKSPRKPRTPEKVA